MKIVIGSNNQGKLTEISKFFKESPIELLCQGDLDIGPVEETGLSFVENAILKARHGAKYSHLPCMADDSGLCVDALGGAPGIYSARYAGIDAPNTDNIKKLLQAIKSIPDEDRSAHFYCVIAFVRHEHDPTPLICQAKWDGKILTEPKGTNGFGYDPVFYIPELSCTAAELSAEQKNQISHRAKALKEFSERLKAMYPA